MGIYQENLDSVTREHMLAELERDTEEGTLYISKRLNARGVRVYADLLREAIESHNDDWLARELSKSHAFNQQEPRTSKKGKQYMARVPVNAAESLAEGEFNRFYLRGLCRRAIAEGIEGIVIYRGKAVANPRSESEQMIGQQLIVAELLDDLRASVGVDTALRLPRGPNSGLTAKLP